MRNEWTELKMNTNANFLVEQIRKSAFVTPIEHTTLQAIGFHCVSEECTDEKTWLEMSCGLFDPKHGFPIWEEIACAYCHTRYLVSWDTTVTVERIERKGY